MVDETLVSRLVEGSAIFTRRMLTVI